MKISVSDGAYSQLLKADGSEVSTATSRQITTEGTMTIEADTVDFAVEGMAVTSGGNLIFNTGGIVEFN